MSSVAQSKREGIVLVASLAAHGLVALLVARAELARPAHVGAPPTVDGVVEFELQTTIEVAPKHVDESSALLDPKSVMPPRAELVRPPAKADPAPTTETTPTGPSIAEPTATTEPAPSPTGSARPLSLASIGIGKNPFVPGRNDPSPGPAGGAGAQAPPSSTAAATAPGADMAAAKARVEASLRLAAREREAEIGLGPEGPVRDALGSAMYESNAPVIGRVVFSVSADAQGHVLSVETVSADRTLADYAGTLAIARRKLGRVTLRLPSTAKGAQIKVEVTSAWKLPSGHDPGIDLSLFGQSFKKGEGKAATRVEVLPIPKVLCTEVQESKSGVKVPTCVLSAPILATDGDPADIGAKPRRIVGTKVLERTVL